MQINKQRLVFVSVIRPGLSESLFVQSRDSLSVRDLRNPNSLQKFTDPGGSRAPDKHG